MAKPNILFILTDQFRPDMLGEATPNINELAQSGVEFTNSYTASPLCQPGRACIATGQFPTDHRICGNMSEPLSLEERQDTYMSHLQKSGYHTALIGKHHYYDRWNVGMDVTDDDPEIKKYGLDHVWQVVDVMENGHNESRYTEFIDKKGMLDEFRENLGHEYYRRLDPAETVDGYIGDKAVCYIEEYNKDCPFYLNVGFVGPHPPYWVCDDYDMYSADDVPAPKGVQDPNQIKQIKNIRAQYKGKIKMIDDYVGKIIEALKKKDMFKNTLIVFAADHGANIGDYGIIDKRFFYEQSVKIPLIMAGPGLDKAGEARVGATISRALVSNIDLYPTFLSVAGIEYKSKGRQGKNLIDIANDNCDLRQEIYSELGTAMMVRDPNWKLVYDAEQGGVQYLFNLRNDPDELNNLAGMTGYSQIEAKYTDKLLSRLIKMTHYTHEKEQIRVQRVRT